jgi:hypothetical protein
MPFKYFFEDALECAVVLSLFAVVACTNSSSSEPAAILTTDKTVYAAGTAGTITIKANVRISYGICTSLESKSANRWVELTETRPSNCVDIGFAVNAGGTGHLAFAIPAGLSVGSYRVRVLSMSREDENATADSPLNRSETVTNEFNVN